MKFTNIILGFTVALMFSSLFIFDFVHAAECVPKESRQTQCDPVEEDPDKSYICMPLAEANDCASLYGGTGVENPMAYPGCSAAMVCCVIPVCAETAEPASASGASQTYKLTNPLGEGQEDLRVIAGKVINTFLGIVGALALLVFVYAGLTYLIAGGNDQMVTKAKSTMKYGVIGVFLIMFSYAVTDSFVTLWTQDLPTSQSTDAPVPAEAPTQAEQEVEDLLSQQQAAAEAEAEAQAAAQAAAEEEKNTKACATKTVNGELVPIRWCKVPATAAEAFTCWSSGCSGSELCCP